MNHTDSLLLEKRKLREKMNKIYKNALLVLLVLSISGCDLFEQKEDIIIMYTNDVASALNGDVGYAGVKGYKDYLENENNYVSLVDAGDFFDGDVSQNSNGKDIVDIMNAVQDNSIWSCKVGKGYNWMSGTGVPAIEGEIEKNTSVIFLMGVNDPPNLKHYINYINAKANEWAALGAQTYFVSVGPVTGDPYVTNDQIEVFNASMEASLAGVIYIDIYNYLMDTGFSTIDGTHYPDWISINIYNYILEHLEPESDGIWG